MRDSDLIERIRAANPEALKQELINELQLQEFTAREIDATWWTCYRNCLDSALKRAESQKSTSHKPTRHEETNPYNPYNRSNRM